MRPSETNTNVEFFNLFLCDKRSHAIQWFRLKRAVALGAELISALSSECSKENKGYSTMNAVLGSQTPVSYMEKYLKNGICGIVTPRVCLFVCLQLHHQRMCVCVCIQCTLYINVAGTLASHKCTVRIRASWKLFPLNRYAICGLWMSDARCWFAHVHRATRRIHNVIKCRNSFSKGNGTRQSKMWKTYGPQQTVFLPTKNPSANE